MADYKPAGWPDVIPRVFVSDVPALVKFLQSVFGAQGALSADRPTELRIGDSIVIVSDGGGVRAPAPAFLYVYVADTDAVFANAMKAGATAVEEPSNMPYGDRRATVRDAWGNTWQIATRL